MGKLLLIYSQQYYSYTYYNYIMYTSINLLSPLLVMFLLSFLTSYTEATFGVVIPGVIALSAAEVTLLAALKVLGVSAGLAVSSLPRNRGKRDVLENNLVDSTSLVQLTSLLEKASCFQLLFCTLATEEVQVDQDV